MSDIERRAASAAAGPNPLLDAVLLALRGGLVVSCQADPGDPLDDPEVLARLALSVCLAGARGIRARHPQSIRAIKDTTQAVVIGLSKTDLPGCDVYITPSLRDAESVVEAGADVLAVDGTARPRPGFEDGAAFIAMLRRRFRVPILADVATVEEAGAAYSAGADLVATTLAGYTRDRVATVGPDFELLGALLAAFPGRPVVFEGRVGTPEQALRGLELGAAFVVVGTAITNPSRLTRAFVNRIEAGTTGS